MFFYLNSWSFSVSWGSLTFFLYPSNEVRIKSKFLPFLLGTSWSLGSVPSAFQVFFPLESPVCLNVCGLGVKHGLEENLNVFSKTSSFPCGSPLWDLCSQLPATAAVRNPVLGKLNAVGCGFLAVTFTFSWHQPTGLWMLPGETQLTSHPVWFFFSTLSLFHPFCLSSVPHIVLKIVYFS